MDIREKFILEEKQKTITKIIENQTNFNKENIGLPNNEEGIDWRIVTEGVAKDISPQLIAHQLGGIYPMSNPTDIMKSLHFNKKNSSMVLTDSSTVAKCRILDTKFSVKSLEEIKKQLRSFETVEDVLINELGQKVKKELDQEFVDYINKSAVAGAQTERVKNKGIFDFKTDCSENSKNIRSKVLNMNLVLLSDKNIISKQTYRGTGNICICSWHVFNLMRNMNVTTSEIQDRMKPWHKSDFTGDTGISVNGMKIYVFPHYKFKNYFTIGYSGKLNEDSGIFYCPYTFLDVHKNGDTNTIIFKTRRDIAANNFTTMEHGSNKYYRTVEVKGI